MTFNNTSNSFTVWKLTRLFYCLQCEYKTQPKIKKEYSAMVSHGDNGGGETGGRHLPRTH